ncbi:OmpA family protein [Pontixanthobacter aquaemixtae]|uniref:OmpA family protein n=1 Tax=Pontixanthobacter aquaemixtae TaxID=1958940 RepID=A0A844ZRQ1_9SPHN|nr:OmpA family protein [Pontixanthobacter aquaemixtae]MXO90194.1 OmpA family protein [Pontixanthobacter aquaemixtae]
MLNRAIIVVALMAAALGNAPLAIAKEPVYAAKPSGQQAQSNSIYFESESAQITPSGLRLLESLVKYHLADSGKHVHLEGHADTSLTEAESMKLSKARALAVAKAFVDLGVDPSRISVTYAGEMDQARRTADGVREPLNRRVEMTVIIIES